MYILNWELEVANSNFKIGDWKSELEWKLKAGNLKLEIENWNLEIGNVIMEIEKWNLEIGK